MPIVSCYFAQKYSTYALNTYCNYGVSLFFILYLIIFHSVSSGAESLPDVKERVDPKLCLYEKPDLEVPVTYRLPESRTASVTLRVKPGQIADCLLVSDQEFLGKDPRGVLKKYWKLENFTSSVLTVPLSIKLIHSCCFLSEQFQ